MNICQLKPLAALALLSFAIPNLSAQEDSFYLDYDTNTLHHAYSGSWYQSPGTIILAKNRKAAEGQLNHYFHTTPEGQGYLSYTGPGRVTTYPQWNETVTRNDIDPWGNERLTSYPAHSVVLIKSRTGEHWIGLIYEIEDGVYFLMTDWSTLPTN